MSPDNFEETPGGLSCVKKFVRGFLEKSNPQKQSELPDFHSDIPSFAKFKDHELGNAFAAEFHCESTFEATLAARTYLCKFPTHEHSAAAISVFKSALGSNVDEQVVDAFTNLLSLTTVPVGKVR